MADRIHSVQELQDRDQGFATQPFYNRDASDADIADKIIARNNPGRISLTVVNLGTDKVYLRPQGIASATVGIELDSGGGSLSLNWRDDGTLPTLEWHAMSPTDNQNLFIIEEVII